MTHRAKTLLNKKAEYYKDALLDIVKILKTNTVDIFYFLSNWMGCNTKFTINTQYHIFIMTL